MKRNTLDEDLLPKKTKKRLPLRQLIPILIFFGCVVYSLYTFSKDYGSKAFTLSLILYISTIGFTIYAQDLLSYFSKKDLEE